MSWVLKFFYQIFRSKYSIMLNRECDDAWIKACQAAQLGAAPCLLFVMNTNVRVNEHGPLVRIMKMINGDREKLSRALINFSALKCVQILLFALQIKYKSCVTVSLIIAQNFMYETSHWLRWVFLKCQYRNIRNVHFLHKKKMILLKYLKI